MNAAKSPEHSYSIFLHFYKLFMNQLIHQGATRSEHTQDSMIVTLNVHVSSTPHHRVNSQSRLDRCIPDLRQQHIQATFSGADTRPPLLQNLNKSTNNTTTAPAKQTRHTGCTSRWGRPCDLHYYRATRMHSAHYAVAKCLSVCLSVRPSVTRQYSV